jgi:hypothetical protein
MAGSNCQVLTSVFLAPPQDVLWKLEERKVRIADHSDTMFGDVLIPNVLANMLQKGDADNATDAHFDVRSNGRAYLSDSRASNSQSGDLTVKSAAHSVPSTDLWTGCVQIRRLV